MNHKVEKIITIFGNIPIGSSLILSNLDINKNKSVFIDIEEEKPFLYNFSNSKNGYEEPLKTLELLKDEINNSKPIYIIIDDADLLYRKNIIDDFRKIIDLIEDPKNKTILILGSKEYRFGKKFELKSSKDAISLSDIIKMKNKVNKYFGDTKC